ncbi:MAG: hypothetical protein MRQ07_03320 [Candidatus Midichloria sp.]|nr:hypothetical protein [Candidatus Midichloria sp.]
MKQVVGTIMLFALIMNSAYSTTMEDNYNQAKQYENSIKLGNPDKMGNKSIFDKDVNISNLTQMQDQDLTKQGSLKLNNTVEGQLLQQGEMKKIDTFQEYDLNPYNPFISSFTKIESDPLKNTEGGAFSVSEKIIKTKIVKSCNEGAEFAVNIIRNLILDAEVIDKWGDWQDRTIAFSGSEISNSYRHWLYSLYFGKRKEV